MLLNIYRLFKLCDYKLPPSAKCGQFCLAKYSILYKKFYSQNWLLIRKEKRRETEIKTKKQVLLPHVCCNLYAQSFCPAICFAPPVSCEDPPAPYLTFFLQILKLNCHFSRLRTKGRKDKDIYNCYNDYIICCEKRASTSLLYFIR